MLENCRSARERWGGVSEIIDRWLMGRQSLLVLLVELGQAEDRRESTLTSLCEVMVDYISAGYFEVYDQLIKVGHDFEDDAGLERAKPLIVTIDDTTEIILDFNDKYQATDDLTSLAADLSQLAETLAARFEAEDRMIAVLHRAHSAEAEGSLIAPERELKATIS